MSSIWRVRTPCVLSHQSIVPGAEASCQTKRLFRAWGTCQCKAIALRQDLQFAADRQFRHGIAQSALERQVALPEAKSNDIARHRRIDPGVLPAPLYGEMLPEQSFGYARLYRA